MNKIIKQQIITAVFFVGCLIGYLFFPKNGIFQIRLVSFFFLGLVPYFYFKYIVEKNFIFQNFNLKNWKNGLRYGFFGLLVAFLVIFLVFRFTKTGEHYFLPVGVSDSLVKFLIYEFTGVLLSVAFYELFFRGFVMAYFLEFYGWWAILIQFVFFLGMLLVLGLPYWFYLGYLIFNPFAGWIFLKSKSLVYSFLGQFLFLVLIDLGYLMFFMK